MFTQRTDDQDSKLAYRKTFIVLIANKCNKKGKVIFIILQTRGMYAEEERDRWVKAMERIKA